MLDSGVTDHIQKIATINGSLGTVARVGDVPKLSIQKFTHDMCCIISMTVVPLFYPKTDWETPGSPASVPIAAPPWVGRTQSQQVVPNG